MGSLDELRTLFQDVLNKFEQARPYDHGLLGDGRGTLWVPNDSDHRVWFRKNGQMSQLVKVHCWRVRPVEDLPVICGYAPEQPTFYQVLTCDREMLELNWRGMSTVPRHAEMHIWGDALGGDDPVMVWTRALMPFRVSPQVTPNFTVRIEGPEMYLWLGTWNRWPGNVSFNLAASYPGAGNHVYVLVSIDGATNAAQATSGTAVPVAMPIPPANYPAPPAGSIPVALVHLVEAAVVGNEIGEANILDARVLVGGSGGSILPAAHALLGPQHSGTVTQAPSQGSLVYGDATPEWNELVIGTAHQLLKVNVAGTLPTWASFDWDEISAAAAADMVHDHSSVAEGGTHWGGITQTFSGGSGANIVTVPDNVAQALNIVDVGGLEYLRIVSLNAQPIIDFNNAQADIDTYIRASGLAAVFVQGSDGAITLGGPSMTVPDGWQLGQVAGPLITFDDTLNYLEVTGCNVVIGGTVPTAAFHVISASGDVARFASSFAGWIGMYFQASNAGGLPFIQFDNLANGTSAYFYLAAAGNLMLTNTGGADLVVATTGAIGMGTAAPGSITEWNMATSDLEFVDATTVDPGAAADTLTGWIQIEIAGVTHYLRAYS